MALILDLPMMLVVHLWLLYTTAHLVHLWESSICAWWWVCSMAMLIIANVNSPGTLFISWEWSIQRVKDANISSYHQMIRLIWLAMLHGSIGINLLRNTLLFGIKTNMSHLVRFLSCHGFWGSLILWKNRVQTLTSDQQGFAMVFRGNKGCFGKVQHPSGEAHTTMSYFHMEGNHQIQLPGWVWPFASFTNWHAGW